MPNYCNVTVRVDGEGFKLVFKKQNEMTLASNGEYKNRVPYPVVIAKLLNEYAELLKKKK